MNENAGSILNGSAQTQQAALGNGISSDWPLYFYLKKGMSMKDLSEQYKKEYNQFFNWVESSDIDLYRSELQQLLYPVFANCYLDLILHQPDSPSSSDYNPRSFFELSKKLTPFAASDIAKLQQVESKEHIQENEYTASFVSEKQQIRLSEPSYQLLLKYLCDNNLCYILAMIHNHMKLSVFSKKPLQRNADELAPQLDPTVLSQMRRKRSRNHQGGRGYGSDMSGQKDYFDYLEETNKKEVRWETNFQQEQNPLIDQDAVKEAQQHGQTLDKTIRKASRESAQGPSVCFFTFFNCKDELNSALIAPQKKAHIRTGPTIISGYADSTIRCWNWCETNKQSDNQNDDLDEEEFGVKYATLVGHCGPVYGLSLSKDHEWLLSSSEDGTVRLWSRGTGSNIVVYKGHQHAVWDVEFSPIDYLFASASHDRTAKIWTTDRVTPVRILAGHTDDVSVVKFHPNANYVATGSYDKTVRLWDVQTGDQVRLFNGHTEAIRSIAFSKDGRYLATGGSDSRVVVWDIATSRRLFTFSDAHSQPVWNVCFNHRSTILASSSLDQSIRIWDITQDEEEEFQVVNEIGGADAMTDVAEDSTPPKPQKPQKSRLISTYYTKNTPIYHMEYLEDRDIILAGGATEFA